MPKGILWTGFAVALVISGVWFTWALYSVPIAHWALGSIFVPAQAGPWGDSFGALSALFAALGFGAVLITVIMQAHSMSVQADDQHRQKFDQTFFQLLGLLRDVRREVTYTPKRVDGGVEHAGPQALIEAALDAEHVVLRHVANQLPNELTKETAARLYESEVHNRSEDGLGPYFRLIYNILRRIDDDKKLTKRERTDYGNLLRGQLSSREVELIALNGLTPAAKDLAKYINRFRILRYMPDRPIRKLVEKWYDPTAFQPRND